MVVENGEPTKDRHWKVKAHKSLPFDAGAIVEMRSRDEVFLTGVRSLRYTDSGRATQYPSAFTVEDLWTRLGLAEGTTAREHTPLDAEDKPALAADAARAALRSLCEQRGLDLRQVAQRFGRGVEDIAPI